MSKDELTSKLDQAIEAHRRCYWAWRTSPKGSMDVQKHFTEVKEALDELRAAATEPLRQGASAADWTEGELDVLEVSRG